MRGGGCVERTLSDIAGTLFYRGVGWAFNQRSFSLSCHAVSPKGRNKIHFKINQINGVSFFFKENATNCIEHKITIIFQFFLYISFTWARGVGVPIHFYVDSMAYLW